MIKRAKRTLAGRALCKLAGDQSGAVMMEYVVLAVLLVAACVLAVTKFGGTISQMFGAGAVAMTGDSKQAKEKVDTARGTAESIAPNPMGVDSAQ